ncbi:MAG: hypothetical protein ACYDBB_26815 [Armatimonadota bacterium]
MFQLGWATRSIVPEGPAMLHGQMHVRVTAGVADPVTVTALALDGGEGGTILVACDLAGISAGLLAEARGRLAARLPGFDVSRLVLHATHTHTSLVYEEGIYTPPAGTDVMMPAECRVFIAEREAEAAAAAWEGRAPGSIARGYGQAVVGHNRRAAYCDGSARMYGNTNTPTFSHIEGYEDHGVDLLYTFDAAGALTGVVVNLACPSQETENDYTLSADFWHDVRVALCDSLGEGIYLLPQCAPAGDQSPHLLLHAKAEQYMLARRGFTMRQELARRIAATVAEVLPVVRGAAVSDPLFSHHVEQLTLPGRVILEREYQAAQEELQGCLDQDPATSWAQKRLRIMLAQYEAGGVKPPFTMELHVIRLGDIAFATNPFELYLDYAERIQARSHAEQTFLVQLCCGTGMYLPSQKAVGKHYGGLAADNYVGPEGGQLLVERTLATIESLWTGEPVKPLSPEFALETWR